MPRAVKIAALASVSLLLVAGIAVLLLYQASQAVPIFYQKAVAVEAASQVDERDSFVARASALASDLHNRGNWSSLFTADEINAWLALELATNYAHLLPDEIRDPRVSITADGAALGCHYRTGEIDTVVSVLFEAYLQSPHVVAIRIRSVRAGSLPVPLGPILDGLSHVARELNLRLEWRKSHGDPVALVTLPRLGDRPDESLRLESIELREGELYVAGTVGLPPLDSVPVLPEPLRVPTAQLELDDESGREGPGDDEPRIGARENDALQK